MTPKVGVGLAATTSGLENQNPPIFFILVIQYPLGLLVGLLVGDAQREALATRCVEKNLEQTFPNITQY